MLYISFNVTMMWTVANVIELLDIFKYLPGYVFLEKFSSCHVLCTLVCLHLGVLLTRDC